MNSHLAKKFKNNLTKTFSRRFTWGLFFTFVWPCIVKNFFIIKPNKYTNFTNLFWHETLHVSDSSSIHHEEFIHSTFSNGICHTSLLDSFQAVLGWVPAWSCLKAINRPVWHIPLLSVQWINSWWWTEELSERCRVSCQNKFVKLAYLVCFIIKKLHEGLST